MKTRKLRRADGCIGVTLLELLVAIVILGIIVLAFTSIETFSRNHVLSSDRRAQVQNNVSYALESMTEHLIRAIGNEKIDGANSVVSIPAAGGKLLFFIDFSNNGLRDVSDKWASCTFDSTAHTLTLCPYCADSACDTCGTTAKVLSAKITSFVPTKPNVSDVLSENYVKLEVTACLDPGGTCNTPNNPQVKMETIVRLPSVSVN
jgi:prepilin-type N-terminal cleavage/methylation domain-containing protein